MGNPKYFPKFGVDLNPNTSHKLSLFSTETLGEKKNPSLSITHFLTR